MATAPLKPNLANQSRDGLRLAVLNKRFEGICRKMGNTLLRTGRSGVLNTGHDFSCCIVTANDELLTADECYPIHVLRGADLMSKAMKQFHPVLRRGDAYLHNSPYHGNTHPADHTIMIPVIDDAGIHRFTVLAKAHQADCGNSLATTYMANARDVYHEGALIFPAVKIQNDYKDIKDIIRMCEMRIRVPEQWLGDYLAMLGAARIGEREILKLGAEVGWDTLVDHSRDWFDYSEQAMADAIRTLKSGRATAESTHDPVPGTPEEGVTIRAKVEIRSEEAKIEVDLRDNPDQLPCGLNVSQACSLSAAMVGVFNGLGPSVPPNAGSFRRVDILIREGCIVGIPRHPASCSVATTNIGDRVTCAVQRALAEIDERIGMAEGGAAVAPAASVISGNDPRANGAPFCNEMILAGGSGPGTPQGDGWLTLMTVGNAGMPYLDSIELDEIHHPVRIRRRSLITDGEGAGKFRGAPGIRVEFGPIDCSIELGYVSDATLNAPRGARGGLAAQPARQYRRKTDGTLEPLGITAQLEINAGEWIVSDTSGGGGYGSPRERDPNLVKRDVKEKWITAERAHNVYGVELDVGGEVDEEKTRLRRREMAGSG